MTSRTTDKRLDALTGDSEVRGPMAAALHVATAQQEMENEKSFSSLLGLQYPRSPLPNNRTANALVLIDGSLQCESLSGVLLKENLRLIRLVKAVDSSSPSTASSAILTHEAATFSFAEPQFVATIIVDEADMFRVHIAEPVSTSMSNCDTKLVEYFRSLVMTLVSRITGRTMTVVKETFSGERWHTCVPCLMECPNIQSFLRHALSSHDLNLPTELEMPTTCQTVSFGPLLILQSEAHKQLHILRTLVSLKLTSRDAATTSPCQEVRPPSPVTATRPSAELLRIMAELIKGIHCESHALFVPTCPDCHELLSAKLGRTKELAPFLACLPDLVAITQNNADAVMPDSSTISVNNMRINSKTLKCPMCNWTYKYRETLEQHLRDKHPDALLGSAEMDPAVARRSCLYCQSGGQHPKLSKGEVYPCGYAAYHCHYCGYKTNTKGNLEIHKQSEKHLMNVQKHDRVQGLALPQRPEAFLGDYPASSPQLVANPLLEQQMKQHIAMNQVPAQTDCERIVPTEFNGKTDFLRCFVCGTFSTGSLKDLIDHVNLPRDVGEEEYILRGADPQPFIFCKLCPYKTYVKANFSVHCNTEKHRQKVGLLAHIYAGDRRRIEGIEWPARLSNMSSVQILCTACQTIHTSLASVERHLQSENHIDAFNTLVYVSNCTQELFGQKLSEAEFAFECRLCAKKMSNVSDLRSHMISSEHFVKISATVPRHCYTKPEILKNILNVSMDSKSQSFNLKDSASTTRLQCPCCPEHLPDCHDLKAHLIKAHYIDESRVDTMCQMATEVKYSAPTTCDATDSTEEGLRENIRITNIADDFCDAFISEHSTDELIYTCDVCYKDIAGATALFEHLTQTNHVEPLNAENPKLLCWKKGCNQYFSSHAAREKHLRKIHMHQQAENSIYRLQCPFCGLAFRLEETFNRHIILHQTLLKYYGSQVCTICHAQIQSSSDLRLHVFKTHSGLNNRIKEKAGTDDYLSEHVVSALDSKSPTTMPHRKAPSPAGSHASPQQNSNTLTCIFCHSVHPTIAEFRAHEQSAEHYQRINAFILNLYSARAAATGVNFMPLPLGMTNANQMAAFLSSISGSAPFVPPQVVPPVTHNNTPTRHVDETSSESLSLDAESPTALQIVTQHTKTSPNEDRHTSPTASPFTGIGKDENPCSAYPPAMAQIPPSTPNSGSSSSSLPTSSQPGLISPTPILPGILSPLGLTAHNFPGQANFNPVLVSRSKPTPSPVTPQEGGKRRGRTRISEEQLQILRQHFHINSPPSDSLIREISAKTGLDLKVIKHWYRNTLFKERQRDKDNPYNFSVPPSTSLNLEEYEKTGRIEVRTARNEGEASDNTANSLNHLQLSERCAEPNENNDSGTKPDTSDVSGTQRRKRPLEENSHEENKDVNHNQDQITKRARVASPLRTDAPKSTEENLTMYQLDYLMSSYKKNSFPSDDQVSQLASEIGLSEERVLGWYAKARADDCSNLNMLADVAGVAEAEAIVAVRCPYCQIIFRLRSQLANHLQSAHPDKPAVDAESLPDGSVCLGMSNSIDARPWFSSVQQGNEVVTANNVVNPSQQQTQRRVRTSITSVQSALLRYIYSQNKNPGVSESKKLSEKLSLSRRVVQVWFQNQRAQEKKRSRGSRLSISNIDRPVSPNGDSNDWLPMDTKVLCSSCIIGETDESHIFSDDHLDAICSYVEARIAESSNC